MEAYAVVETGGKQYRVEEGTILDIERLSVEEGSEIELSPVLALSDGENLIFNESELDGAKVSATVLEHNRAKKVVAFKKKRRQGYRRKIGHRQNMTRIKVSSISAAAQTPTVEPEVQEESNDVT